MHDQKFRTLKIPIMNLNREAETTRCYYLTKHNQRLKPHQLFPHNVIAMTNDVEGP